MDDSDLSRQEEDPLEATPRASPVEEPRRVRAWVGILQELWLFMVRPRSFVAQRKLDSQQPVGALVVLMFSVGGIALLWGLYSLTLGSFNENVMRAAGLQPPAVSTAGVAEHPTLPAPVIATWGYTLFFGFSVYPVDSSLPSSVPQRVTFITGAAYLVFDNVVPKKLGHEAILFLGLVLFAAVLVACLYIPARFLGGRSTPAEALRISILYLAYVALAVSTLPLLAMLILGHALGLRGSGFQIGMVLLVQIPMVILVLRGYFASFAELFGLTKWRLGLASVGAMLLSLTLSPILCLPAVYLMVRFQPFWELLY